MSVVRASLLIAAVGLGPAAALDVRAQDEGGDLVYQVQALLEEVRELRGMVESQQHELENLRRRQRDQYLDLDRRLQSVERSESAERDEQQDAAPASGNRPIEPASEPESSGASPDVPEVREPIRERAEITPLGRPSAGASRDLESAGKDEKAAYDRAFRALRETRYADAAEGFADFLESYPESAYAPNALYWLAETYYVTRDFSTALDYFNELLDRFPDSAKQGDALLKIGFSHYEQERWNEARAALEQVRSQYPGTTLSRLAESRLRDMRLAGHY